MVIHFSVQPFSRTEFLGLSNCMFGIYAIYIISIRKPFKLQKCYAVAFKTVCGMTVIPYFKNILRFLHSVKIKQWKYQNSWCSAIYVT